MASHAPAVAELLFSACIVNQISVSRPDVRPHMADEHGAVTCGLGESIPALHLTSA